jgi:small-conductance mechanosensitive channel
MEPNAQGQQPGAENPVLPDQQPGGEGNQGEGSSGVQKRIDELTREKYEAKARADAMEQAQRDAEARNALLLQALSEQAARGQQQAPPPEPELDPEQARVVAAIEKRFKGELNRLEAQNAALAKQVGLSNITSQVEHADPRVKQRAREIAQGVAQRGLVSQFSADDITLMAEAAILREDRTKASSKGQPQPGLLTGATPAPRVDSPQKPQGHPPDLKSWSLAKQEEYWLSKTKDMTF